MSDTFADFVAIVKSIWLSVRSNPYFVTAYTAAITAGGDLVYTQLTTGHADFSKEGIRNLLSVMGTAVFFALWHLYTPKPQAKLK